MNKYRVIGTCTGEEDGPEGWPLRFELLPDDYKPQLDEVIWSQDEYDAWHSDPKRKQELDAWQEKRPKQEVSQLPPSFEVTNFQLRAALIQLNLFDTVNDLLRQMGGIPWQAWEYSNVITRGSPLVAAVREQLNKTEQEVDELFMLASNIVV